MEEEGELQVHMGGGGGKPCPSGTMETGGSAKKKRSDQYLLSEREAGQKKVFEGKLHKRPERREKEKTGEETING